MYAFFPNMEYKSEVFAKRKGRDSEHRTSCLFFYYICNILHLTLSGLCLRHHLVLESLKSPSLRNI